MDSKTFKDRVARLQEVNGIVSKLDEAIRAEAFSLLKPYVTGEPAQGTRTSANAKPEDKAEAPVDTTDAEAFFTKHPDGKPAENVSLIAAYLYSQYGTSPFSIEDVRKTATAAGVTIPERPDMTIRSARRSGKKVFQRSGQNQYKPTVHGEAYFKSQYKVGKGKKIRAGESE